MLVLEALELHRKRKADVPITEFGNTDITTMTIAAASVLIAALLIWGKHTFNYFWLDFILGVVWFIVFGLRVASFSKERCDRETKNFAQIAFRGHCNELRAVWGFAFLSGFMWLGTFVAGIWAVWRERKLKSRKRTFTATVVG